MEKEKELAAHQAVSFIKSGMVVGLGTGSTASYMIRSLAKKVEEGLSVVGVPSSERSAVLAESLGIQLSSLEEVGKIDINIDGADEFDPELQLIKGGGGALLREKIIAHNSNHNIIIADSGKQVEKLGKFKLPVEVIPFAAAVVLPELDRMGLKPKVRMAEGKEFRTDENNCIIDLNIWEIEDMNRLNTRLLAIPGIVETGLFLGMTDLLIMGKDQDTIVFEGRSK